MNDGSGLIVSPSGNATVKSDALLQWWSDPAKRSPWVRAGPTTKE
ncbi:MAG: hypothetical protein ABSB42_08415 [Tepidisphaeraceae bacterium]|jgi:hypothetical protein